VLNGAGPPTAILLATEDPGAGGTSWWDGASGLLLAVGALYATWAQFVYPKIVERRARRQAVLEGDPVPPQPFEERDPPAVDPVIHAMGEQSEVIAWLRKDLGAANRKIAQQSGTIARLEAELRECRRRLEGCTCHS